MTKVCKRRDTCKRTKLQRCPLPAFLHYLGATMAITDLQRLRGIVRALKGTPQALQHLAHATGASIASVLLDLTRLERLGFCVDWRRDHVGLCIDPEPAPALLPRLRVIEAILADPDTLAVEMDGREPLNVAGAVLWLCAQEGDGLYELERTPGRLKVRAVGPFLHAE